jgi:type IV pilus assembly protein PilY1
MTLQRHTVQSNPPGGPHALLLGACALLVVLGGVGTASAQLPPGPPTLIFSDDFNSTAAWEPPSGWMEFNWDRNDTDYGDWKEYTGSRSCAQDRWLPATLLENNSDNPDEGGTEGQHLLVVGQSLAGGSILNPDKANVRIEFDFQGRRASRPGAAWAVTDTNGDQMVDDAYIFYFSDLPRTSQTPAEKASWHLVKRVAGADMEVATGVVDADAISHPSWQPYYTVAQDACYRLRVDFFCGYTRVQVKQFECVSGVGCTESDWLTLVQWFDDFIMYGPTLAPGGIGFFSGSDDASVPDTYFDNFEFSSWGESSCDTDECTEWSAWTEENREPLVFKHLYEGGLIDYSAGRNVPNRKIDVATTPPDPLDTGTYCDGWKLLVDLPDPIGTSDTAKVSHFLQDTATAVDFLSDGGGGFSWSPNYDEDEASATYNPVPMVADGSTPIAASLMDAYDWFIDLRSSGGRWEFDTAEECRKWYVVLITDGADTCATPGTFACDPNQAADKFANPSLSGVDKVPVFTIGFSESVSDAPPELSCISDITGGQYFGARNASELKDALYNVITQLNTDDERSFVPFKVSPPPSSAGGTASAQDFLLVYPYFIPVGDSTVWDGNLYGFKLDETQPTIPANEDCEIDATALVVEAVSGEAWDAAARLADQLAVGSPTRHVFMASDGSGSWARHDLTEIPTDATLRLYFQNVMSVPGGVTDLETQEVVNFVRNIWVDNDTAATPDPRPEARPAGSPVLGDSYHSQPVIVNPPNRSMFFFDYGYGNANDYPGFMEKQAKRRRVVLAGANDGLLHAFDGGIWDRNRAGTGETYDEQHDLGNGQELFTYLPQAVMPRLYNLTYGKSQDYLVDGQTVVSDAFIDYDGDSDREWRTVAISTMRRGGRGMVALDITQPDPLNASDVPAVSRFPGCIDGTTSGCDGDYPKVLWEFSDTLDADLNSEWDLGWTWSKPAIARIAINDDPNPPDDVFVAFFGGGWDRSQTDQTGNFIYGVNVETGAIVYKHNLGVAVPGSPTAHDSDIDGFHDRIYFADSDGGVHRLQFPSPGDSAATGADAGTLTRIFDFRSTSADGGFPDRQQFFTRPVMVPALFGGSGYTWALALGTGDRANIDRYDNINDPVDHFFFMLDNGDTTTRGKDSLVAIDIDDLAGDFECTAEDSPLDPSAGNFGWYLNLRPNEKVMYDATVINGHVLFPTFDPTPNISASHNVPDECVPASTGSTPTPTTTPNVDLTGNEVICNAAGLGRSYDLWFECGLGEYSENDDIYTGVETYTIGGTTYVTFTESSFTEGETEEFPNVTGHVVTNWRQD